MQSADVCVRRRVAFEGVRGGVAAAVTASVAIPQFWVEHEADLTAIDRLGLSLADVVVAASARALTQHHRLNAWADANGICELADVHIAVAVALADGLVAPTIRHADRLSLPAIESERRRLTAVARAGRLRSADLTGATFMISNLGPLGVKRFQAMVLPPQVAVLAVGGRTVDGRLPLVLTVDHRAVDGAPAAHFLSAVVALMADHEWLMSVAFATAILEDR